MGAEDRWSPLCRESDAPDEVLPVRVPRRCVKQVPISFGPQLRALAPELFSAGSLLRLGRGIHPDAGNAYENHRSAMANKEATVAELTENFRSSNAVVLTEYRGLTVAQLKTLRKSISEHATYAVVKNTLTKIAANEAGITSFDDDLVGPSAIAFVHGDTVAV